MLVYTTALSEKPTAHSTVKGHSVQHNETKQVYAYIQKMTLNAGADPSICVTGVVALLLLPFPPFSLFPLFPRLLEGGPLNQFWRAL